MDPRRRVPGTDVVLADPRLVAARELLGGVLVKAAVARAQDLARSGAISPATVADVAAASLPPTAATLTLVINATGVLVHTNLGRAPLSAAARDASAGVDCLAVPTAAVVGGGGGPGVTLPSAALSVPERLAPDLRSGAAVRRGDMPAVAGRIEGGRLLLDLRAVAPADDTRLAAAVLAVAARDAPSSAAAALADAVSAPGGE